MVKYHMRRIEKEIKDKQDLREILKNGKYTTISMCKDNEPYIVALSYGYDETKHSLYIHCAKEGQKIDFIKANPHICGIIIEDKGYKEECGQAYRSVVYRGKIEILGDIQEKKYGLDVLLNQLEKDPMVIKHKFLKKDEVYENSGMLRVDITDISGKEEKAKS